jgi:hypothetical protein
MEHPPLHISEPDLSTTWFPTNITLEDAREAVAGRVDFKETKSDDYYSFVYFLGMVHIRNSLSSIEKLQKSFKVHNFRSDNIRDAKIMFFPGARHISGPRNRCR